MQHWDNPAPIGKALSTSMECLQLEIGCQGCPLSEPYSFMGPHCTHSWVRSFWECVDTYNLQLTIDYESIQAPRENDITIMSIARGFGYSATNLESVNRCRLFTESLFLSDVVNAAGNKIDPSRCGRETDYSYASTYSFPKTCPSDADWLTWENFWRQYCLPDNTIPRSLGKWRHSSHKRWRWWYQPSTDTVIYWYSDEEYWRYQTIGDVRGPRTRGGHCYARVAVEETVDLSESVPISVVVLPKQMR